MPTVAHSELPKRKSWDEFEDIVWDLYGRQGQLQHGVDICGRPPSLQGRCAGVQGKRYADGRLTPQIIRREVAQSEQFQPPLAEFTVATTEPRDGDLRSFVLNYTLTGDFPAVIADLEQAIALDPQLAAAYYLRRLLRAMEGDLPSGRDDLDRPIALNPTNADGYSSRAALRTALHDVDGAIADHNQVIALSPRNAAAHHANDMTYTVMRKPDLTCTSLARAIELDPSFRDVIRSSPDFDPIRTHTCFQALLNPD